MTSCSLPWKGRPLMQNLPDAPWIRDAEINGVPDSPEIRCPYCGKEAESFFKDKKTGEIIGCNECIEMVDAYDEYERRRY